MVVADQDLSLRTAALDFGVLSDDTLALKVEAELADGTIEERDLILIRDGDLVSVVRLIGPRPSDKELFDSVVRVTSATSVGSADDTTDATTRSDGVEPLSPVRIRTASLHRRDPDLPVADPPGLRDRRSRRPRPSPRPRWRPRPRP